MEGYGSTIGYSGLQQVTVVYSEFTIIGYVKEEWI